jgi:hypothetical protein
VYIVIHKALKSIFNLNWGGNLEHIFIFIFTRYFIVFLGTFEWRYFRVEFSVDVKSNIRLLF